MLSLSFCRHPLRIAFFAVLTLLVPGIIPSLLLAQPLDPAFRPDTNDAVYVLATRSDGKILVGGAFTEIAGVARNYLARLHRDGSVDLAFNPAPNGTTTALRVLADGKILIGGAFTQISGSTRSRVTRLNSDGSIDSAFNARIDDHGVENLTLQPDGRILVGGFFTVAEGLPRAALARLNADGSIDRAFDPAIVSSSPPNTVTVGSVAVLSDGRILIGGNFVSVGGQPRRNLARLNADGSLDSTFSLDADSAVTAITPQSDGRILLGGGFTRLGVTGRNHLARLNVDGSLDPTFTTSADDGVMRIALQSDGKIVLGGRFATVGGIPHSWLARLNSNGSLDPTLDARVSGSLGGSTPTVFALAVPTLNEVVFGGAFNDVSGQPRHGLARLGTSLPVITAPPASVFASASANVTFSVAVTGEVLRYQWKRNGVDIPGATGPTLSLANLQATNAGTYTVVATNSFGSITSTPATLSLGSPPLPTYTFTTLAGSAGQTGRIDGTGSLARFDRPTGLTLDAAGNLYSIDTVSNFVRKITPAGVVTTLASQAGQGIAVDALGNVYVADSASRIMRLTPAGVASTLAGSAVTGSADGPVASAQFRTPRGLAFDAAGNLYVADTGNFTIRRITPGGTVSTLAGLAGTSGSVDGQGGAARFNEPLSVTVDAAGNLYVADRTAVRKVSPDGNVTTVASVGAIGIAIDSAGNLFATDATSHVIRRLAPDGTVAIVGGATGLGGTTDGPGAAARFNSPWGIAVDRSGTLYVADNTNSTLRRATPDSSPLAITLPPVSTHADAGVRTALSVGASGANPTYQWKKNGVAVPGATTAAYILPRPSADADMGHYSVAVSSAGATLEAPAVFLSVTNPANPGRLINVATRGLVPPGGSLTPGFVLRGSGSKQLLVRGVGSSLARFGLGGTLADPRFELAPLGNTTAVFANNDWSSADATLSAATAAVGAFPLDTASRDAAALAVLNTTGASAYTVRITGPDTTSSGLALAEIYDADPLTSPVQLANVSTRGFVGIGANALVPGFVIGGGGPVQVLIRAVGPGLASFGVTGLLADPQISVVPLGNPVPVAGNDNWADDAAIRATLIAAFAAAGAFPLPADSKDAALLVRLPPGAYTVIVSGVANTTGNALVEIYDIP